MTLSSQEWLALVYQGQGKLGEAETLFRQTIETRRRVSGPDHSSTLAAQQSLAEIYWEHGKHAETEALLRKTLEAARSERLVTSTWIRSTLRSSWHPFTQSNGSTAKPRRFCDRLSKSRTKIHPATTSMLLSGCSA